MNPLSEKHLQQSDHLSSIHVDKVTLRTDSLTSLRDAKPLVNNKNDTDARAAAAMCQYAYYALNDHKKPKAELIDGWKPMTDDEVDRLIAPGFHHKLENKPSGFNSMLFQKKANGIQYYAYCTEGTEVTSIRDWYSNFSQGITGNSPQHTYSVQIAKKIDSAIGDKAVLWFIGHSLGGGLASNNSLATGRHAITFNAAGLHILRVKTTLLMYNWSDIFHYGRRTERIHAFVIDGEILNSSLKWFGQSAYGTKYIIHCDFEDNPKSAFQKHNLTTQLDCWGIQHD